MGTLPLLTRVAFRNLFRHRVKSLIVGAIMAFGTFLILFGFAHVSSIQAAMEESVTSSVAGHLQVYSANAKDELAIFGGMSMSRPDIGHIADFAKLDQAISDVPNVKEVVPMGIDMAFANSSSDLDRNLAELRAAVNARDPVGIHAGKALILQHVQLLAEEAKHAGELSADTERVATEQKDLARATSDAFWGTEFEQDPLAALEFLENRIAPIAGEGKQLWVSYVGTDLDLFRKTFDRFEIVQGEMVPEGKRGILLNQKFMEDWVKHLTARELDKIKKARESGKTIAGDTALAQQVARNSRQYRPIMFQLDPTEAAAVEAELRKDLPEVKGGLAELLQAFLSVTDENFDARYARFYEVIAPRIRLYEVSVGDILTMQGWTRSGYQKSVNLKIYGTFKFKGVEGSELAGALNLIDLASFRELLGLMTADKKKELDAIKQRVGVAEVKREDAEAALFGDGGEIAVAATSGQVIDEVGSLAGGPSWDLPVTRADREGGAILNAAIILDDPSQVWQTRAAVEEAAKAAGIELKVVNWQQAAGFVGQFIFVVQLVLFVAILIITIVALVIINNTMLTATLERTGEIGTMRAIGAQRRFVLAMFVLESMGLGLLAGIVGAVVGGAAVAWLGSTGVPATSDFTLFLFGGPRLYPHAGAGHYVAAIVATILVGLVSAIYPARLATRVQPIEAMRAED